MASQIGETYHTPKQMVALQTRKLAWGTTAVGSIGKPTLCQVFEGADSWEHKVGNMLLTKITSHYAFDLEIRSEGYTFTQSAVKSQDGRSYTLTPLGGAGLCTALCSKSRWSLHYTGIIRYHRRFVLFSKNVLPTALARTSRVQVSGEMGSFTYYDGYIVPTRLLKLFVGKLDMTKKKDQLIKDVEKYERMLNSMYEDDDNCNDKQDRAIFSVSPLPFGTEEQACTPRTQSMSPRAFMDVCFASPSPTFVGVCSCSRSPKTMEDRAGEEKEEEERPFDLGGFIFKVVMNTAKDEDVRLAAAYVGKKVGISKASASSLFSEMVKLMEANPPEAPASPQATPPRATSNGIMGSAFVAAATALHRAQEERKHKGSDDAEVEGGLPANGRYQGGADEGKPEPGPCADGEEAKEPEVHTDEEEKEHSDPCAPAGEVKIERTSLMQPLPFYFNNVPQPTATFQDNVGPEGEEQADHEFGNPCAPAGKAEAERTPWWCNFNNVPQPTARWRRLRERLLEQDNVGPEGEEQEEVPILSSSVPTPSSPNSRLTSSPLDFRKHTLLNCLSCLRDRTSCTAGENRNAVEDTRSMITDMLQTMMRTKK